MHSARKAIQCLTSTANRISLGNRSVSSSSVLNMPIKVGEKLPSVDLYEGTPGNKVNIGEMVKGKKVVIFGVPGAFTPTCSKSHLPGFVDRANEIKGKGVSEIVCVSVNDPFVMAAWGEQNNAQGKVRVLADTSAEFTKAIDVGMDIAPLGGIRSKRYSMLVDDGVVKVF